MTGESDGIEPEPNPGEGVKLDLLADGDGGANIGDCGSLGADESQAFSIIWIANTTEGTVSKIDTASATELARYRTGPVDSDPSRMSVCGLIRYDTNANLTVAAHIELPGCSEPVGVSVDADGLVWVVDRGASTAYRVDPDTQMVSATVTGLVDPYTYSDMTGAGLDVVVNPEIG